MTSTRGKNYGTDELKQVVYSVLAVSQDPIVGNGQKSEKYWAKVKEHYDTNKPKSADKRNSKLLESKWANIKHDVSKFIGVYQQVEGLQISGTNSDDTLLKVRELYKQNHPENKKFSFEPCFWILKEVSRWQKPDDEMASKRTSKSTPTDSSTIGEEDVLDSGREPESDEGIGRSPPYERKRPGGNKKAKDDLKRMRFEQDALKASMKHQSNVDITNAQRIECMQVNIMMRLIMMPTSTLNPEMRAFAERFQLIQAEKLQRLMDQHHAEVRTPRNGPEVHPDLDLEASPRSQSSPVNAATVGDYYVPQPREEAQLFEDPRYQSLGDFQEPRNAYQGQDNVAL